MSWDSASMPLAAIVVLGRPSSRSGSTTATFGSISGLLRLALTPPPDSTELRVTSEPVPAVVGTATQGRPGLSIGRPAPMTSRCSRGSIPEVASTAAALATSIALPPPNPSTASQPASASSAMAARTRSIDGSVATPNGMLEMPASLSADRIASARDVVRPVTTRTRLAPSPASASGTSLTLPAPNRTSAGTARSKRTTVATSLSRRGRC